MNIFFIIIFIIIILIIFNNNTKTECYETTTSKSLFRWPTESPSKNFDFKCACSKENFENNKTHIVTIETRNLKYNNPHNKSFTNYAIKHGYTYEFLNDYKDPSVKLPVYWWKIQYLLNLLKKDKSLKYVVWADSDTIILNPNICISIITDSCPNSSIFIADEINFTGNLNAGFFIIKNNDIGVQFLEDTINNYIKNDKCNHNGDYHLGDQYSGECYEQGVMNKLLKSTYQNHICKLYQNTIISVDNENIKYNENSFIYHLFASLRPEDKINEFFEKFI
jgi:hypothetical protein